MKPLYTLLLILLVAPIALQAQRPDTRLSGEPLGTYLPEDAKIESVAEIGGRTLSVWGTSRLTPDSLVVNTLVMQMFDGTVLFGAQKRLASDSAHPASFVQVVPLADRFLVVWNDKRNADTVTWMRLVDLDGNALGEELPLGNARVSGFGIAAKETSDGYLLLWNNMAGAGTRIRTATLDSSGMLVAIDSSARFAGKLGGAPDIHDYLGRLIIDRGALAPLVVDSSGTVTIAPALFVNDSLRPWYLDRDGSVITGGSDSVRIYRSVFDSTPYRSIALPSVSRLSLFFPMRDSLRELRIRYFMYTVPDRGYGFRGFDLDLHGYEMRLTEADTFSAPVKMFERASITLPYTRGSQGYSLRNANQSHVRQPGNRYLIDFLFEVYQVSSGAILPLHRLYSSDVYGIGIDDGERDSFPIPPGTTPRAVRLSDTDSSVIALETSYANSRLSAATATRHVIVDQSTPGLSLRGDRLFATWSDSVRSRGPAFTEWNDLTANETGILHFSRPADLIQLPPSASEYVGTFSLGQSGELSLLSTIHYWRDSLYRHHATHAVFEPDTSGWRQVTWIDRVGFAPGQMSAFPYVLDPNTGRRVSALSLAHRNPDFTTADVFAYNADWSKAWEVDSALNLEKYRDFFLPLGPYSSFMHFVDGFMSLRQGRRFLSQFPMEPWLADRFFVPLPGLYFLQVSRADIETFVAIRLYSLPYGTQHAEYRIDSVHVRNITIAQNSSDSSLAVVYATDNGVHLVRLGWRLDVVAPDIQLSAAAVKTARPAAVIRNDTLIAVWEDYRNGSSDVYGTFVPLKTPSRVTSQDGASDGTVVISAVVPNPANDHARIRFARPLAGPGSVELIDNLGRVRMRSSSAAGTQSVDIDCSSLPVGLYTVVVRVGSGVTSGRLVVVR